jgi:hypothetical protein
MAEKKKTLQLKDVPDDIRTYIYRVQAALIAECPNCSKTSLERVVYKKLRELPDFKQAS